MNIVRRKEIQIYIELNFNENGKEENLKTECKQLRKMDWMFIL